MRIGIDARFLGPKQKGLGRYVQKLVENIFVLGDFEFVIFLRKENFDEFNSPSEKIRKVLADWKWYTFSEQIFMPFVIWREKIDLMHFPHFNVPIFCPTKFIVTIHDLVLKKFPTKRATTLNPLIYKIKEIGYKMVLNNAIKKSEKIIVPSNFTKKEIIEYFKIDQKKIEVVFEGVSGVLGSNASLKKGMNNKILEKYGIKTPYILYVGNAYPHKNLEGLIGAFDRILNGYKLDTQLILVGEIDYFYEKIKNFIIDKFSDLLAKRMIIFTGFVPEEELPLFYKNASLYVSPAFSEGFGLPALEAISYGTPAVSSKEGAQPEILGDAALYFDPKNIEDIAEKISLLFKREDIKRELVGKGLLQIQRFNWSKMAKHTVEIYKSVLAK